MLVFENAVYYTAEGFRKGTVTVSDGKVFLSPAVSVTEDEIDGKVILPGLADAHVHLREPGFFYKESIATGSESGARAGYTALFAMPNLSPVPDSLSHLREEQDAISRTAKTGVYPYAALTVGERGEELSAIEELAPHVIGFSDGRKFISGNKCEKGAGLKPHSDELDIYAYKYERIQKSVTGAKGKRGRVGIPLALVFYEQLPLWAGFFERCGFEVVLSEKSSRQLYFKGQHTVASDTVCYPAKLTHGHIESLLDMGVDFIFYPCESYNLDEHDSTNHYNCPVVAYYPELLKANNERLNDGNFVMPYIDPNDEKTTVRALYTALKKYKLSKGLIKKGLQEGFARLEAYYRDIRDKGSEILAKAEQKDIPAIILAGRPYHVDPEINHGIGKLLTSLNMAVLSEDSVFFKGREVLVNVLNQWTYHARLYRAAEYAGGHDNVNLVQLVSFGCGIDAITTDEVRSILEKSGKLYTQIKIDEINNLGVVKIRLRSMLAAIEEQKRRRDEEKKR